MVIESDVELGGGGRLHVYDTGGPGRPVFWHHGTPNIGAPPEPLFAAAERHGLRWVSYDRPGYGGSTAVPDRPVASAAHCSAAVADALGLDRFATFGHSGGAPHALAAAGLLPDRVTAVVSAAGLAPYGADGLDWFAGMGPTGSAKLRSAVAGRAAREAFEDQETGGVDFLPADEEALDGEWCWFLDVVHPAVAQGPAALIDDDLAFVAPWGFEPAAVRAPVLLLHGAEDRIVPAGHSRWLAGRLPAAELWELAGESHVSVLRAGADALAWLGAHS